MISKKDHCRLQNLLSDAISLLCRNSVPFRSVRRVDALIGITLDNNEVILVNVNESLPIESEIDPTDSPIDANNDVAKSDLTMSCERETATDSTFDGENDTRGCVWGKKEADSHQCSASVTKPVDEFLHQSDEVNATNDSISQFSNSQVEDSGVIIKTEYLCNGDVDMDRTQHDVYGENPLTNSSRTLAAPSSRDYQTPPILHSRNHTTAKRQSMVHHPRTYANGRLVSSSERYGCHMCGAMLCSTQALRDHIRGTHFSMYSYVCNDCGLTFKWRSTLRTHRFACPMVMSRHLDRDRLS